jgi:CRP-like cAMP-binding protein
MPARFPADKFQFKSSSVFRELPVEELAFLKSRMVERKYKRGQRIFVEGTFPSGIYYVKKGRIKKYKADRDGKEQIIYICNAEELLGYPALLSEEAYSDSAAALEDSVMAFIPKDDFLEVLSRSAVLSNKLLKNLSHEFGVLVSSIATFAHRSVRERLALSLLNLKEKYRIRGNEESPVEINLSRADLANTVGTAVETLVRLLHDFKEEGLIETSGRKIRILDAKRLVKVANFY